MKLIPSITTAFMGLLCVLVFPCAATAQTPTKVTVGDRIIVPITFTSTTPAGRVEISNISFTNAQLIALDCGGSGLTVSENTADGCTIISVTAFSGTVVAQATIEAVTPGSVEMQGQTTATTLLGANVGGTLTAPKYEAAAKNPTGGPNNPTSGTTTTNSSTNSTTNSTETKTTSSGSNGSAQAADTGSNKAAETEKNDWATLVAGIVRNPWTWVIGVVILAALAAWLTKLHIYKKYLLDTRRDS